MSDIQDEAYRYAELQKQVELLTHGWREQAETALKRLVRIQELQRRVSDLKSLLTRAADALASTRPEPEFPQLIAELRKAAQ
jgi:hypothetical protein